MRLDRFLIRRGIHSGKQVAAFLAEGRVTVNGSVEMNGLRRIHRFTTVALDGEILQQHEAVHIMLHKPAGHLSATADAEHPVAVDLIDHPLKHELHLAGRLDRATTGLLLLTNDGVWSKKITEPVEEIPKVYRVRTRYPVSAGTAEIFKNGIYFAYEDLVTQPAFMEILGDHEVLLTIHEGRYHHVKRMFHAVGNQVVALHRESIGKLVLDPALQPGAYRHLTAEEVAFFGGRDA